jgi:hypothetical protein
VDFGYLGGALQIQYKRKYKVFLKVTRSRSHGIVIHRYNSQRCIIPGVANAGVSPLAMAVQNSHTCQILAILPYSCTYSLEAPDDGRRTPETCRLLLIIKIITQLHLVGHIYDFHI